MKKKSILLTMISLAIMMGLVACSNDDPTDAMEAGTESTTNAIAIRMAFDDTVIAPCTEAVFYFKELVEERSNGQLVVEYLNDGNAMGGEDKIVESVNRGLLEMGMVSGGLLATYAPDWYLVDLPCLFFDRDELYGYLDGEVGDYLKDAILDVSKIEVLDIADNSFKIFLNTKKPITRRMNLEGMKFGIREESQMIMDIYRLGWTSTKRTIAVPMAFDEMYTALQKGKIDGVDTSILFQVKGGFYEIGKYYTMTNHQALVMTSIVNKPFIDSLPDDLGQIIRTASYEAFSIHARKLAQEAEIKAKNVLDEAGLKEHILTDRQRGYFINHSGNVIRKYGSIINPILYEMIGSSIGRIRPTSD